MHCCHLHDPRINARLQRKFHDDRLTVFLCNKHGYKPRNKVTRLAAAATKIREIYTAYLYSTRRIGGEGVTPSEFRKDV